MKKSTNVDFSLCITRKHIIYGTIFPFLAHYGKSKNSIAVLDGICFLWTSFTANFGGKPTPTKIDKTTTYKMVIVTSLLSGLVIWMAYRSMLIAVFSVTYRKYPFSDIESFSKTDWR